MLVVRENLELSIEPKTLSLLAELGDFFAEQGVEAYLTGGFIRDALLGRETADIDIALAADALEIAPEVAATLGGRYVLLDAVNRVGRVVVNGEGGHRELDFTTLRGSIEQDLKERDFTVNAMALALGELGKPIRPIDPFHGQDDLRQGVIRAVTETVFEADAARLLRAVRLAAELGFRIDSETERLIRYDCHLISAVAGERIREELLRLLAVSRRDEVLHYLDELGLLAAMMPELAQLKGVKQPKEHFWDVFAHSLKTVEAVDFLLRQGDWEYASDEVLAVVPWSEMLEQHFAEEVSHGSTRRTLLKMAALLHDIAKPQTKTIEAEGRIRFLGHATEGAVIATSVLQRLRFSAKEVKLVETMVRHHLRPGQMNQEKQLPTHRAIYRYFRDTGDAGIDTLFLGLADHLATRGPNLDFTEWQEQACQVDYVLTQRFQGTGRVIPPKLVDGHDLINIFDLKPGPRIGQILEAVREAQAAGELTSREEALAYVERLLVR